MDQSIVIGSCQFVGFYLTEYLLNQGEKVVGVDWTSDEEKEMEIGRNANFSLVNPNQLAQVDVSEKTKIYISWYDICKGFPSLKGERAEVLSNFITACKGLPINSQPAIIFFLPLGEQMETEDMLLTQHLDYEDMKLIYLPTIYGPWQPVTMAFEAAIQNFDPQYIRSALQADYRHDAIYVDDLFHDFFEFIKLKEKSIILKSKAEHQWVYCAEQLIDPKLLHGLVTELNTRISKSDYTFQIKNKVSPLEGISLQKQHYNRLKNLDWENTDGKIIKDLVE